MKDDTQQTMGLEKNALRFLLEARKQGMAMGQMATLGRQRLGMSAREIAALLTAFEMPISAADAQRFLENGGYIDTLMNHLGVSELTSFDASDYQDATYLHDMNQPIPERFHEQFDLIIDGGTLEHVFDFPTAIKNVLSMVRVDGRFMMFTPTNNWMGHGFYQFSPELMYRVCHPDNGYKIERMHLLDMRLFRQRLYEVADPSDVHNRVMVTETRSSATLFVQAIRIENKPVFATMPQQSDYSQRWEDHIADGSKAKIYSKNPLGQRVALILRRHPFHPLVQKLLWLRYKGFYPGSYSPRYFKRIR